MKSLDDKLNKLRGQSNCREFILADAKDADMAWGTTSPGVPYPPRKDRPRVSLPEYLDQMREITRSGYIDILLASTSTLSVLAHREKLFENSLVTPAIRANDTTDIWLARGAAYRFEPSRPFRTTFLREAQFGSLTSQSPGKAVVNLGLYSITFNNVLDSDLLSLHEFRDFRADAASCGFEYFLEVFAPNVEDSGMPKETIPFFVNDSITRALAGVARTQWPKFLKIPYFGPEPMEELASYDPELVVGILGGGAGTTYDAFKQISEAKKYGARAAIYGRKIKEAEHPLTMAYFLRAVADEQISAEEAVRAYHGKLQELRIQSRRKLEDDLQLTSPELSYAR
jgi:hypothetical protein